MSLAHSLLNSLAESEPEMEEDITTLVIDHYTRTIHIPKGITTLGVESDDDVLRLNFKMPRYLGTVDLYNFEIRVNYINAAGEDDVYKVTDKTIVGNNITFSWLVGPTATAYKGRTKFNVCMVITDSNSVIKQEYNTAATSLPVLEGLECSERVVSEYTDILDQWERRLFGISGTEEAKLLAVSRAQQDEIANKGTEVLATIPEDYTTTYNLANESARTKADAIICSVQGEVITVSDSSDDNLRGLRVFGKTTQVKTTGAQLAWVNINVADYAYCGVTSSATEDGNIIIDGTATERLWNRHAYADLVAGETYTLSSNSSVAYSVWDVTTDAEYMRKDAGSESITFVAPNTGKYAIALCNEAGSVLSKVRTNLMLNAGDTALPWEPYTGGVASPCPDYPQELVSVENPTVTATGANLFDINKATLRTGYGLTGVINSDGSITVSGTPTNKYAQASSGTIKLPLGTYYVSGGENAAGCAYFQLYATKIGGGQKHAINGVFVVDGTEDGGVHYSIQSGSELTPLENYTLYPMFNIGETPMPFEPYKHGGSVTSDNTLPGIPVTSGGNYTDANGKQWICDEVDFERGVYVQRIKVTTVSISSQGVLDSGLQAGICKARDKVPQLSIGAICDRAKYVGMSGSAKKPGCVYENVNTFGFTGTETDTLETLQAAYDGATIAYILANPIETPLTADELAAFQALKSNYPNTTVLNDAGVWMSLRYNADTETWIKNLIDEKIAAAVANQ